MMHIQWNKIVIFSNLDQDEIKTVQSIFDTRTVAAGEIFIHEGGQGSNMFILISGNVRVTKSLIIEGMALPLAELHDPKKVLATLDHESYPIFGEMALLDQEQRSASVEALVDSKFLVTDKDRFFNYVEQYPAAGAKILASLGNRLAMVIRRNNQELVKLTTALALALSQR